MRRHSRRALLSLPEGLDVVADLVGRDVSQLVEIVLVSANELEPEACYVLWRGVLANVQRGELGFDLLDQFAVALDVARRLLAVVTATGKHETGNHQ